jgi:pyridoxamine 5'-phosphate oxidase
VSAPRPLLETDVDPDPLLQLQRWLAEAREAEYLSEPMSLATATPGGRPSVRMVLLKGLDERGLVFYTSSESRKGTELEANPHAALLVYWPEPGRQVRIEGPVEPVSRDETDAYFRLRPRGAQIGAGVSRQSRPIGSREELDALQAGAERELEGREPPLPDWWTGYRVVPEVYEFWQHRDDRLHDRLRYTRDAEHWRLERLQP